MLYEVITSVAKAQGIIHLSILQGINKIMKLMINGSEYEVANDPPRSLLWVLHDELGLIGVITSYSIHYTKLYDGNNGHLFLRHSVSFLTSKSSALSISQ